MSSPSPSGLSGMDPGTFTMLQQIAKAAAESKLIKGAYGNSATEAQCLMKLLYGHDLGIPATAALTGIQIYDGQMEVGARLLAGLVQRHPVYGYDLKECDDRGCTLKFLEHGLPVHEVTYGIDEASRAGLLTSDWYAKHPEAMFFARAMSTLVGRHCPDVAHGIPIYAEGEIQAGLASARTNGAAAAPAEVIVTEQDVIDIKKAAKDAGVNDAELYNVIAVAAGGRGGVAAAQAAERLAGVWPRMPQRYKRAVIAALADSATVTAAQTETPAASTAATTAPAAPTNSNGSGEKRASDGDVQHIRAVAAEHHVNDAALLNLIADVAGGERCDDDDRAARDLLPATLAAMPLRFVQPVLTRLRPNTTPQPTPEEHALTAAPDRVCEQPNDPQPADSTPAGTVSVAFSAMEPRSNADGRDDDTGAPAEREAA
ncbi:MAG: hypothetical protein ACLGHP_03250 [Vicinamibacteria bacterium]